MKYERRHPTPAFVGAYLFCCCVQAVYTMCVHVFLLSLGERGARPLLLACSRCSFREIRISEVRLLLQPSLLSLSLLLLLLLYYAVVYVLFNGARRVPPLPRNSGNYRYACYGACRGGTWLIVPLCMHLLRLPCSSASPSTINLRYYRAAHYVIPYHIMVVFLLELQSRLGDKPLEFQVLCPKISPRWDCSTKIGIKFSVRGP